MTSPGIAVENLSLALGDFDLGPFGFALSRGEILVILGPNGSGKSLTLETIAGFHRPDTGRVLIAGRDVTALAPERRNVGFVVQNFGLFPHLTVAQNVAIACRSDQPAMPAGPAFPPSGDVSALLGHFGVAHLATRVPQDLSPGEKQRVALARALGGAPDIFLFDEPFASLDAQTRDQLRDELLSFLRDLSIPAIFVTHDHADAEVLGDKVLVLRNGSLIQTGPAAEIFSKPANSFVARFVGVENVFDGMVHETAEGYAMIAVGESLLRAHAPADSAARDVKLSIRAEAVSFQLSSKVGTPPLNINRLAGRVSGLRRLGPLVGVEINCGFALRAYALALPARTMGLSSGSAIEVEIATDAIHVMTE